MLACGYECEYILFHFCTGSILRAMLANAITVIFEYIIEMALLSIDIIGHSLMLECIQTRPHAKLNHLY